jgi:hypothetical protein
MEWPWYLQTSPPGHEPTTKAMQAGYPTTIKATAKCARYGLKTKAVGARRLPLPAGGAGGEGPVPLSAQRRQSIEVKPPRTVWYVPWVGTDSKYCIEGCMVLKERKTENQGNAVKKNLALRKEN